MAGFAQKEGAPLCPRCRYLIRLKRMPHPVLVRARAFCDAFNARVPIPMAPMAGACPPSLAIAVANAGGLGGCGALLMQPDAISKWARPMCGGRRTDGARACALPGAARTDRGHARVGAKAKRHRPHSGLGRTISPARTRRAGRRRRPPHLGRGAGAAGLGLTPPHPPFVACCAVSMRFAASGSISG